MKKKDKQGGLSLLFGITFISPVTYSVLVHEMDVVQRVFFFAASLLLFLVYVRKVKIEKSIQFTFGNDPNFIHLSFIFLVINSSLIHGIHPRV